MLAECNAETTMEHHLLVCMWEEALQGAADSGPRAFHLGSWFQATTQLEGPPRSRPVRTSIHSPVGRCQWTVKQGTLRITEFMVVGWGRVWKNKYRLLPRNAQSLCVCGLDRRNYFMGNNPGNYHGNLSGKWKGCVCVETNACSCFTRTNGTRMDKLCRICGWNAREIFCEILWSMWD